MEQFESAETLTDRTLHDDEIRALLLRLHRIDIEDEPRLDHRITIEDIAEAMDAPVEWVHHELMQLREERRRAQIESVFTELEEPLFRVERPTTEPTRDVLGATLRRRSVETILDKLAARQIQRPRTSEKHEQHERHARIQANFVLWLLLILSVALIGIAMLRSL